MGAAADTNAAPRGSALKRIALAALIAIVTLNVWTGSPLLALWVGSRVQGEGPPSMAAVAVFLVLFIALSWSLVQLLKILSNAYDAAGGQQASVRQHVPWLRSMRGERERGSYEGDEPRLTAMERILVLMVVGVFVAFEIWFFFFSTSPIDQRTGRAGIVPPAVAAVAATPPSAAPTASRSSVEAASAVSPRS